MSGDSRILHYAFLLFWAPLPSFFKKLTHYFFEKMSLSIFCLQLFTMVVGVVLE